MQGVTRLIVSMVIFVTVIGLSLAQDADTCPAIVEMALANVQDLCSDTGRNQVCYGNITLEAEAQPDVENLQFDTPGDITDVALIQSLALTPLDEKTGEWGVSLMRLQANLPDTLPGQNVTMLVFGDVEIENAAGGASEDETPMQAFYFRSGVGDAPCSEAPDSGILIQTPKGAGEIALRVNEVDISLGSTAYLQAEAGNVMTISVLEGQATVTAFDVTQTVPAGEFATVPIDDNLAASGPPVEPKPYAEEIVEMLSGVVEILPEPVVPTAPESPGEIETVATESKDCTVTAGGNVNFRSGPGTVYPRAGGIEAGISAKPSGQAVGADGYVWYQLIGGKWVRSDVVEAVGRCESLPVVAGIPATPVPLPPVSGGSISGGSNPGGSVTTISPFWPGNNCSPDSGSIYVRFSAGTGGWHSEADAIAATGHVHIAVTIDGQPGPAFVPGALDGPHSPDELGTGYTWWGFTSTTATVELSPGTHQLFFTTDDSRNPQAYGCTYTAGG